MTDYFFIKHNGRIKKVLFGDIVFVEGLKNYCRIHTRTSKFITLTSMKDLENFLPADQFIRIHKSYIIAVNSIDQLTKAQVCLQDIDCLPVGETFRPRLHAFVSDKLL